MPADRGLSGPLATVIAEGGSWRLAAVDHAAAEAGLAPGLPLTDARARVPGLETMPADLPGDHKALEGLTRWCNRYTPWSAVDDGELSTGGGGLWLDIGGCGHLFGGEDALLEDLSRRLVNIGLIHRLAVADTPGAAWALARFGRFAQGPVFALPAGQQQSALGPLPVTALRLPGRTVEGLHRMGLRNVANLLATPRGPLTARFGPLLLRRLDQALGTLEEPIDPLRPAPAFRTRLAFAEPIGRTEDVEMAVRRLLDTLCRQLTKARRGARRLELTCCRTDATVAEAAVGTRRPVRDPEHLARLFRDKLDGLDAGFGIEAMILAAPTADLLASVQGSLDNRDGAVDESLSRLIDRLGNRLGAEGVRRLAPRARHVPERAATDVSALEESAPSVTEGDEAPTAPRPLRLLPWPEPIQVMAPVPDDPPVMFRWRHHRHKVVRADGPERIGPEWWREAPEDLYETASQMRDYYRIEDEAGARFWVYRQGLYRPDIEPRWFLHGFFP